MAWFRRPRASGVRLFFATDHFSGYAVAYVRDVE